MFYVKFKITTKKITVEDSEKKMRENKSMPLQKINKAHEEDISRGKLGQKCCRTDR